MKSILSVAWVSLKQLYSVYDLEYENPLKRLEFQDILETILRALYTRDSSKYCYKKVKLSQGICFEGLELKDPNIKQFVTTYDLDFSDLNLRYFYKKT